MFSKTMFDKGAMPVLQKTLQFTNLRAPLLANNLANVETPFYESMDLDTITFRKQLQEAIERRRDGNPRIFEFRGARNVYQNEDGTLTARSIANPIVGPMRHSQNNVELDRAMVDLAKNTILHNTMVEMLKHEFSQLSKAIAGRVTAG